MVIAFTGHRKYSNIDEVYDLLTETIKKALNKGIYQYISGLAQGIDQVAIDILDRLKKDYPKIYIIGARPFNAHGRNKKGDFYSYYQDYLNKCDEIVLVSKGKYHVSKYHIRDRWMVDNADYVIAILDNRNKGGAYQTVQYSKKPVYRINPKTLEKGWL